GRSLLGGSLLVPRRTPARRNRCRRTRHRVEFPEGYPGRPFPCRSTDGTGATRAESTELRLRVEAAGSRVAALPHETGGTAASPRHRGKASRAGCKEERNRGG